MSSPIGWVPPKTKLKLDCEIEPVPTLLVTRTTFEVNEAVLGPDGNPTVTPQETVKRFKLKGFHPGSSAEKFAAAIVPKTDGMIPAKGESAVVQVLNRLKAKLEAAGYTAPSAATADAAVSPPAPVVPREAAPAGPSEEQLSMYYGSASGAPSSGAAGTGAGASRPGELNTASRPADSASPQTAYELQQLAEKRAAASAARAQAQAPAQAPAPPPAASAAATAACAEPAVSASAPAGKVPVSPPQPAVPQPSFQGYDYSKYAHANPVASAGTKPKKVPKQTPTEIAKVQKLDAYMEDLYEEDIDKKIRATGLILQLVQSPEHLERLAANQQLTSALSRVLADDRKKSIALTTNILEVFFCFSSISQLHSVLTANKIGNTALNVIDFELKRYEVRVRETRGESDYARLQAYLFKQEKLLFVCFYILLNMSEDLAIELRIKQRKVIPMLFTVLAHHDNKDTTYLAHLRLLCVAFLKKLSMIESNIPELLQYDVVRACVRFMSPSVGDDTLCSAVLRLAYNLSFHRESRLAVTHVLAGATVAALQRSPCASAAARLMYVLSTDPTLASAVQPYLAAVPGAAVALVLQSPGSVTNKEACALAINMAAKPEYVTALLHGGSLPALFSRLEHTQDVYVAKLIRALSEHAASRADLEKHALRVADMVLRGENPEIRMEALGILANTPLNKHTCLELMTKYQLWDFLMQNLVPTQDNDDIALQVIMLIGNLSVDSRTSGVLTTPKLVNLLDENLAIAIKEGDSEMVLQILFTVFRLLQHRKSREVVCQCPAIHDLITNCIGWPHPLVRTYANSCMDVILEHPGTPLKDDLMTKRFEVYNEAYMAFIADGGLADLLAQRDAEEQAQLDAEALEQQQGDGSGAYDDGDGGDEGYDSFYDGGRLGGWGGNANAAGGAAGNRKSAYGNGYGEDAESGDDEDALGSGAAYSDEVAQVRSLGNDNRIARRA